MRRRILSPPRSLRRGLLPAASIVATMLATGCLVPTDGNGGPFGELRVRSTFTAGNDPATIQVHIDSVRTLVTASGETGALVDTIQPYSSADTLNWLLGLQADTEDVNVQLELRSGEQTMYRGAGQVVVGQQGLGTSPVHPIPVDYVGPPLARRVQVTPHQLAFATIGTSQQLNGTAYDANGEALPDVTLHWASDDENVATVDAGGLVTSTGIGATLVVASANGVADTASISVDTTLANSATITADSASMTANGSSTSVVTVEVRDANGNLVGASAGTVTLATTLGSLSPVTDHDDGTYTATLTAATTTGTAVVTGTLAGAAIQDSAVVEFTAGSASTTTTTIAADSASMTANGSSTSTVTVKVRDANGNLVGASAGTVTLATTLGSLSAVTDHNDGTYTATLTADTTTGKAIVTGTLAGTAIQDSAVVDFVAGPPSTTTTTITADSASLVANGSSTSAVTVRVLDANGNPVGRSAGTVTLATTLGSLSTVTDHNDGTYTATLTAGTATGAAVITGTLAGAAIQDSAVVDFVAGPPSTTTTTITADSTSLVANGRSTSTVRVEVRDANGNLVGASAGTVTLATTLGSLGTVTDHNDGTYTATLTADTTTGTAVITGTLAGAAIQDSAVVDFVAGPPSTTTTTITADSASMVANGSSTSAVTVRVLDANGNPVGRSAGTVTLATTLGSLSTVTDHNNGTYTATLTAGTTTGTAVVNGTLAGAAIQDSAFVEFVAGPPNPTTTTITADSASMTANGTSNSIVTVRVLDANGNPVGRSAGTVTLSTTLGSLSAVTDHNDGTYTATLTADTTTGKAVVTGTLAGAAIQDSALVQFVAGPADPTTTTITADPDTIGTSPSSTASAGDLQPLVIKVLPDTSRVTVTVRDANGNPVGASAGTVTLTTTLGSLSAVTDNNDGTYTATLTAGTTSGTAVITGTLNGTAIADSATVTIRSQ